MTIKNLLNRIKNNRGFTLLEMVLSVVIAGAVFGVASETMLRQADTYQFISSRKTTIADVRFAMNHITYELQRIDEGGISEIGDNSITFTGSDGSEVALTLSSNGSDLAVYQGNDILIPQVASFDLEYQTGDGTVLEAIDEQIENVKRIKVTVTTEPISDEGSISMSTTVVPRAFIGYANFD